MTFTKSISTCFSKYVDFKGRASRSEYWWFWLFTYVIGFLTGVDGICYIAYVAVFATLLPSISVAIRRMHDTGRSGWWVIVPIVNIVFALLPSDEHDNQYGSKPEWSIV